VLQSAAGGGTAVVLCGPDGRPGSVVDASALAAVPVPAAAVTPATAVSRALGAGAYVPEWVKGQELIQYLSQLEGQDYAVIDHNGHVTGLLRQAAVVTAITGKAQRENRRPQGQNR
ncbi:MAG: site-2 protease family protein, partial [Actinomycetota bacterium]|nr:site-2 protease family protein [Actinomycetota bacterium]